MPADVTTLNTREEAAFQAWAKTNGITDVDHPDSHYDYRGFWQQTKGAPHTRGDHFSDTFKEHGHPTFSVESKYSKGPNDGGRWNGETYVPAVEQLTDEELQSIADDPKLVAKLTDAEKTRLGRLSAAKPAPAPTSAKPPLIDRALDALPAVGGAVGGVVGGAGGAAFGMGFGGVPGAIGGATLGGGAGEAVRQLGRRVLGHDAPATSIDAAKDIGKEGAVQGAMEVAGQGAMHAAAGAGRVLMENAVRPTMSLLQDFPNVMAVIERERLPVGRFLPFLQAGSQRAANLRTASARAVRELLVKAEAAGKMFSPDEIAKPVLELVDDISKQPLSQRDMQRLGTMLDEFLVSHPGDLTPVAVKELKQRAQSIAKPIFKAEAKGFPVSADQPLMARFNDAVSRGAKEGLETIPGVAQGEKQTQDLIGAGRALRQAEARRLPLAVEGISASAATVAGLLSPDSSLDTKLKDSAIAYLVARGLGSPRTMSRVGLALTSAQIKQLFRQFPRLAEAAATQVQTGAARPARADTAAPAAQK